MPGCRPPCVTTFSGTNRQKWNYVKNLYMPSYTIDGDGDYTDNRSASDVARIADEDKYDAMYAEDLAHWQATRPSADFEKWLQWQYEIGTIHYGNLPQHKKSEHVGYCWFPCPYSNENEGTEVPIEWSRYKLGLDDNEYPLEGRNDHGIYYMKLQSKGNNWGFECSYDGCTYYVAYGERYFYV